MTIFLALALALSRAGRAAPFEARTLDVLHAPPAFVPAAGLPALPAALRAVPVAPAPSASAPISALQSARIMAAPERADRRDLAKAAASSFDGAKAAAPSEDEILHRAVQLARKSKSRRARFGAIVVDKDGRIVGEGWNRVPDVVERRLIGVGQIMHAEQAATAQALLRLPGVRKAVLADIDDRDAVKEAVARVGGLLDGARLYVVGISKDGLRYFQKIEAGIACEICARTLGHFHVDAMSSSAHGFVRLPWDRLLAIAKTKPKWWQHSYKGKAPDPNIRWVPIADLESRLNAAPKSPR